MIDGVDHSPPTAVIDETVYPPEVVDREVWVTWILDEVGRKRPVAPWQTGHAYPVEWNGNLPDEERPETDFDTAQRWARFNSADLGVPDNAQSDALDIGILLPNDRPPRDERLCLVDWDDVRDPESGEIHPVAAEYIAEHGGYVEVSTSGEGLHQFVFGGLRKRGKFIAPVDDEPFVGDDLPQVEIYDGGRHVAMTGQHVKGTDLGVVDGQDMIDEIVRTYADAERDAGHRRYDPAADTEALRDTPSQNTTPDASTGGEVPAPDTGEYDGPAFDTLRATQPDDRPFAYHAVVEAFYRGAGDADGYANVLNWRLEGSAAALGAQADLDAATVKEDLAGGYLDDTDVEQQCVHETPHRVDYAFERWERGAYEAPSRETLVQYGVLPEKATPRAGGVTFDPRDAWRAAGRVTPSDLDGELGLATTDDGDDWVAPHTGEAVDAVRAAAIDAGVVTHADELLDDAAWSRAYDRLRREFDAPVPEYVSREGRAERYDTVIGAVEGLTVDHLDTEAFNSEIVRTGDDCRDEIVMNLNPAWRESESEDSVFVYEGGPVYEPEPRVRDSLDPLRFVALDSGLITFADYADTADGELLQGETFSEAYRRARDDYGAPLPRLAWSAADHTVVLPDADDVSRDAPGDPAEQKRQARQTVAEIVGDAARTPDESTLVTALPGLGKSYAAIKTAAGEEGKPVLYTAGRKELQAQAVDHAGEVGASAFVLPVFGGDATPPATVIDAATEAVHNQPDGQRLLKRRWELREVVEERLGNEIPHPDDFTDDDDDAVDLDREVCATAACDADSADELGWWLAVHTARALGFRPAEIHEHATELFGATLPCGGGCDGHDCPYTEAWEAVRDPDNPTDVLIGSPQHAHVTSARTYYERGSNNKTDRSPRAVVVDEYPGDAWDTEFDDEWTRHAAWLASAVADDVPDAEAAVRRADRLWNAPGVRDWLRDDGEAGDPHATLADRLGRLSELVNARETAVWLTDTYETALRDLGVADGVQALADSGDVTAARDALAAFDTRGAGATVVNNLEDVRDALQAATTADGRPLPTAIAEAAAEADTVAGPLAEIVERAVTAAREVDVTDDDAVERARDTVQAAQTACRGGRRAVELLAVYDDDGRAHPAAGPLLWALLAPSDSDVSTTHEWQNHELAGDDDPVRISAVDMGRTTVLADRAHRFATVRRPPALEAGGGDCPLVGLDATGRPELWQSVLGTDMRRRDPHGGAAGRREFLRQQGLRVIQTTPEAKTYGGSVDAGSMDGDTAVVEAAADEYAPQVGDDPAVVTTLKAEHAAGDRFEAAGADSVDHYGDLKGSNRLGDQRLGVLLGCQHHGHGAVERAAAFAHQDATPTGRGIEQSYGSEVGNAYLRYMWHDSVMQAALRFGRDPEIDETVVVAHTAALREDLPVVAEGDVVKTYSAGEKRVAEAVADLRGSFTTADVRERLPGDPNPRSVRRQLAALVEAGHLDRTETPNGVANQFSDPEAPGAGQVELPSVGDAHPDDPTQCISYTWTVRVGGGDTGGSRHRPVARATLPSPETAAATVEGDPPPS